ncbi:possible thioredoxin [Alloactinosynnema sp. L-07]|uniref:TlpA family protein disulfide reductase n=1 Tax=Alloactinosynnema sp. L-07 TaxID=1653480 RepID=UPI00065EF3B2|nr:TlpA disulfide reductase family protein [Alloactinosynnema sp. L-07]CRK55333.1 possible thioredoxin [Alloactinosynnema sp. L-07]
MTTARRWVIGLVVLVVAVVVAVWPRQGTEPAQHVPTAARDGVGRDLAAARAAAGLRPCPASATGGAVSGPLTNVRATCLGDGTDIDLGSTLAGRPALVNVWATWCQPCREELPVLEAYAASAGAVSVLGVQVRSDSADGLDMLAGLGVRVASVHDTTGAVAAALRLPAYLPVSYVVLPDGTVHRVEPPTPFRTVEQVRDTVDRYLSTGA